MVNVDAEKGAVRYSAKVTNQPGKCLWEVQVNGYAAPSSIGPHAGQYPTALAAWNFDTDKHPNDLTPPRGAAVYFGVSPTRTDALRAAGDVVISLGNGLVRCSDGAGGGRMATMTIQARAKQIQRPYLGYALAFLGHRLVNLGPDDGSDAGGSGATFLATKLTPDQVRVLQTALGISVDGIAGVGTTKAVQTKVGTPADGDWGAASTTAMQTFVNAAGYTPALVVDGDWGAKTTAGVVWALGAGKFGVTQPSTGTVSAQYIKDQLGVSYVVPFQEQVNILADGIVGPQFIGALEKAIGRPVDSSFDKADISALQAFLGIGVDELWGQQTTNALKVAISEKKFSVAAPPPGPVLDPAAPWKGYAPDSELAAWIGSPNYNRWPSSPDKTHITLHRIVGSLASADATFQVPGEITAAGRGSNAATNYGVGPAANAIHQYIREADYQHGDGNRDSNTHGISIEHEGGQLLPDGSRAPVTRETLANGAKLMADIAKRRGWKKLVWMENVFPHKHWTTTECPGDLDYAYEIELANAILIPVTPPDPEPEPEPDPVDRVEVAAGLVDLTEALKAAAAATERILNAVKPKEK